MIDRESSRRSGHIEGLDGLRALAALAVFGVHFNQIVRWSGRLGPFEVSRLFANGNHGVSLFFTLSGFLLSIPFFRAMESGEPPPPFGRYAVRRVTRILPAYYLCLTVLIVLQGLWRVPGSGADILLHYLFAFNYTEFTFFSINPPFWTLAVEVQFYLLLPLFLLPLRRTGAVRTVVVVAVMALLAYGLHVVLNRSVREFVAWPFRPELTWIRPNGAVLSHSLFGHLPHFLIGVAAARLFLRPRLRRGIAWEIAFWLSAILVLVILGTRLQDSVRVVYGRYTLPLVPLLLAVMVFAAPFTSVTRRVLEGFPLRPLGIVSYGIYIYHVPCLTAVDRALARNGRDAAEEWVVLLAGGLLLTVLAATASYFLVERPVRRLATGRRPR